MSRRAVATYGAGHVNHRKGLVSCLATVLVVAVSACGSGTATHASTSPAPAPSPSPAVLSARQASLQRYFADLLALSPPAVRANLMVNRAWLTFRQGDVRTWLPLQRAVERWLVVARDGEVRLAAVTPPKALKQAHLRLLKSWAMDIEAMGFLAKNLRLRVPYGSWMRGWDSRFFAAGSVSHEWWVAVKAEARRQHLPVPKTFPW